MVYLKPFVLSLALLYFLDGALAVTCDVAPTDPTCVNCYSTPTHPECFVRFLTPTTVAPLSVTTTRRSRIRRIRSYFGNIFRRFNKNWF
ncbi:hypothetical protein KR026_008348 [Drosophila bipectinata]|nr:hypothetical protein KR026_008348 [Drosophila bipectinata]